MKRPMKKLHKKCFTMLLMALLLCLMGIPLTANAAALTAPATVKTSISSYNSITVKWSGVKGAVGYRVYRATSKSGTYSLAAVTTSKSFKNTGLATGTRYYYKIRAYKTVSGKKVYSKYSSVVSAKPVLNVPTAVKAAASSYNSIALSWGKVTGASGYRIYRVSGIGSYSKIADTKSLSFTDSGVDTGTVYYYKIRAYITIGGKNVYSSYSGILNVRCTLAAPTSLQVASTTYDSAALRWNGVTGANGYEIYRAAANGSYSKIADAVSLSYSDTGLDTGVQYSYKVRAYITNGETKVYSNDSSPVNATCVLMETDALKVVSVTYDSISLQWNAVDGANGYELYIASSGTASYTLLTTVSDTAFISTGLTAKTAYTYKVRAYRDEPEGKAYSDFSSEVKGTTASMQATAINLSADAITMSLGESETLIASVVPADAVNGSIVWESSDDNVAIVDAAGTVTPISTGSAVITASTTDGSITADCMVSVNETRLLGIDVSKWQGAIDWSAVKKAGIQFAMIRSTYGSTSVDPKFEINYSNAKANQIAVGVYHYSYATTVAKAVTEVQSLISNLEGKQLEYPVCLDLEDSSQSGLDKKTLTDIALTYITYLEDAGYYPMIYCNKTWFTSKLDDTRLSDTDHWLAQWGSSYTYTGQVSIWQYSSTGKVSGISGNVDMDYSFVDYAAKIKYLKLNGFDE